MRPIQIHQLYTSQLYTSSQNTSLEQQCTWLQHNILQPSTAVHCRRTSTTMVIPLLPLPSHLWRGFPLVQVIFFWEYIANILQSHICSIHVLEFTLAPSHLYNVQCTCNCTATVYTVLEQNNGHPAPASPLPLPSHLWRGFPPIVRVKSGNNIFLADQNMSHYSPRFSQISIEHSK